MRKSPLVLAIRAILPAAPVTELLNYTDGLHVLQRRDVVVFQPKDFRPRDLERPFRGPKRVSSHDHDGDLETVPVLLDADGFSGRRVQEEDEVWYGSENLDATMSV